MKELTPIDKVRVILSYAEKQEMIEAKLSFMATAQRLLAAEMERLSAELKEPANLKEE